jgi:hypothetical protein
MKLKKYKWIGPPFWSRFAKGDKTYHLSKMTDEQVEALLKEDHKYWCQKFEEVKPPANKKADKEQ